MWYDDLSFDEFINNISKDKILYVSYNDMTQKEKEKLGKNVIIQKLNNEEISIKEYEKEMKEIDIIALGNVSEELQGEFFGLADGRPVIMAEYDKNGNFIDWKKVVGVEIEKDDFDMNEYLKNK